ncbi:MAG: type II secretion system F family protein [Planctomycetes bacterium]|nr:type II secretion system F family protein [Planctomycetota bacterium]MCG2683255.1 type II secretion system F family protein [Planctomycetales bacterium]
MNPILIAALAFIGVAAIVGGAALLWREKPVSKIEDRLDLLTGANTPAAAKEGLTNEASILAQPLDDGPGIVETFMERFGNIGLLFEQADTNLTIVKLLVISAVTALLGISLGVVAHVHAALLPLVGLLMGLLPLIWLLWRRKRRLKAFASQLPDALEMISRTLRAGQSLGFGFNMVSTEMPLPISKEFGRVFEEQNLGIQIDETLRDMTERIPNLDLKFFVTALILQRQTGGDLAEILDKIGALIRDRFRIWGQVQALTGEGRLSGVVLLALPFVLFVAVYQLNPEYVMVLFNDPLGTKMLAVGAIMQVIGALVIRKIVNIKV